MKNQTASTETTTEEKLKQSDVTIERSKQLITKIVENVKLPTKAETNLISDV